MAKPLPAGRYAAIMGDLVASTEGPSFADLHAKFNDAIERENRARRASLASPLTITLGDEFQGLARTLADGLAVIRSLRLDLLKRGVECRFALGLVDIETPVNAMRAWNMMGTGLARTRQKLNEKREDTTYRFALDESPTETALEALGASLTAIERRWTPSQLAVIDATLGGASAQEIAKKRNVTAHSVYKVRSSGELDLYLLQWHAVHEMLGHLDHEYGLS